jgi:hypothetical protein
MWSAAEFKEEGDDSTSTAAAGLQTRLLLMDNVDAHVFIPGFRLPKPATDLTTALQQPQQQGINIPSSLVNRLVSLRSRVILAIAAGGSYSVEESASVVSAKLSKRRISQQGLFATKSFVLLETNSRSAKGKFLIRWIRLKNLILDFQCRVTY